MKYRLRILNLKCYLPDEADGDEVYIISEGKKVWPQENNYVSANKDTIPVGLELSINKGDYVSYELWDHDLFSTNDLLGSLIISADAHGQFVNDFTKEGKDQSKYALEWEIG